MDGQDYAILEDLLDTVEQLQQRLGHSPKRNHPSSPRKLRVEIEEFRGDCRNGRLKGRDRKVKSGELFRRIISLYPRIWRT